MNKIITNTSYTIFTTYEKSRQKSTKTIIYNVNITNTSYITFTTMRKAAKFPSTIQQRVVLLPLNIIVYKYNVNITNTSYTTFTTMRKVDRKVPRPPE